MGRWRAKAAAAAGLLWAAACTGAFAAEIGAVSVSAVVVSKNNCKFSAKSWSINVTNDGTAIDPSLATTATGSFQATFSCNGASATVSYVLSANDGLQPSGGMRRMRHATLAEYLPYSLSISPASGSAPKASNVNVTVTASVVQADFQNAAAGTYSDTVVMTVAP